MNQKLSISLLVGGLATFLSALGTMLSQYKSWSDLSNPSEVGQIILLTASFCSVLAGALGTQLPRKKNTRVADREPKENIVVTQIEERDNG